MKTTTFLSAVCLLAPFAACATGVTNIGYESSEDSAPARAVDPGAAYSDAALATETTPSHGGNPSEESGVAPAPQDSGLVVGDPDGGSNGGPDSGVSEPPDAGALASVGSAQYVVTNVSGFGMYCVDLDDAVFGTVGDVITVDFQSSGVTLVDTGASLPNCGFSCADLAVGTQMISNLGGSVDTQTGKYTSSDTYNFLDDQNPGGLGGTSQFYYSLTLTLTGNTLVIAFKIPNPQGDVTCTLMRQ